MQQLFLTASSHRVVEGVKFDLTNSDLERRILHIAEKQAMRQKCPPNEPTLL
jgi:hypothetical protein